MAVTSTPIFAQTPYAKTLTLVAQTACGTDGPTSGLDGYVDGDPAGWGAVDLYDGCLLHDPTTGATHLVDLDLYHHGPYVLDADRQVGSTRFMAPEEWQRGATIDTRTTVFTLGRTARVLLGESGSWRGGPAREHVVERATQPDPADRWPSVGAMAQAWHLPPRV